VITCRSLLELAPRCCGSASPEAYAQVAQSPTRSGLPHGAILSTESVSSRITRSPPAIPALPLHSTLGWLACRDGYGTIVPPLIAGAEDLVHAKSLLHCCRCQVTGLGRHHEVEGCTMDQHSEQETAIARGGLYELQCCVAISADL
jgi:hypothetical protein